MALIKAFTSSLGARLLMAVLNYGLFWLLSHRLAATELGGYSLLMNVFYLLQTLPLLGLSTPLARRVATEPEQLRAEMSTAAAVALPVSLLIALGCGLTGQLLYPTALHTAFWLLAASLLPSAWLLVTEVSLIGREQMSLVARVQCLVALGGGLELLFTVFLGGRLLSMLIYRLNSPLPSPRLRDVSATLWRRNWSEVPVFLGIAVLAAVGGRIDLIVLSRLAGLEQAGIYAAASRLYDAALMLPTIAAMVILPALSRLYQSDRQRFADVLGQSLRACLAVGLAIALGVAALSQPLIELLYAPQLHDAGGLLRWLIFGAVLMTLDQILSSTMIAAHAQAEDLRTLVIAVLALGLLLLLGISLAGPLGAAIAVPTALLARVGWRLRWLLRHHPSPGLASQLARTALAALCAGVVLIATLPHGPLLGLAATLATYGLSAFALGVLQRKHLNFLTPWLQRARLRVLG
jgi:O-antigen/teichoic acid export membrane protein